MGLGSARDFDLGQARERALAHRRNLSDKIDPLTVRRAGRATAAAAEASQKAAAAKAMTFKQCAKAYIAENQAAWRNRRHGKQWHSTLETFAYPIIGDLNVSDIDTPLVLTVLRQKVEAERGHPAGPLWKARAETASRLRGRIESILSWAKVSGYRSGDNPARWKDHLEEVLPERDKIAKVEHHPALPFEEVPAFMAELRKREGVAARALEFTILTSARSGQTLGAPWSEIDLAAKLWTIPAERMKAERQHRVPLAAPVIELLENLHTEQGNPHLFIGTRAGKGLSDAAMTSVLKRMGHGDITTHGFRSTFMDWAHERTAFPKLVIDMALAHSLGDKTEAAYRRGDLLNKRRQLAEAWARYCSSSPARQTGKVVPLRGAQ
jgi:integrase